MKTKNGEKRVSGAPKKHNKGTRIILDEGSFHGEYEIQASSNDGSMYLAFHGANTASIPREIVERAAAQIAWSEYAGTAKGIEAQHVFGSQDVFVDGFMRGVRAIRMAPSKKSQPPLQSPADKSIT